MLVSAVLTFAFWWSVLLKMIKRFNYWINHLKVMLINMF